MSSPSPPTTPKPPPASLPISACGSVRAGTSREDLSLTADELAAYQQTTELLQQSPSFLAPFPSVVSLRDLLQEPLSNRSSSAATATSTTTATTAASISNAVDTVHPLAAASVDVSVSLAFGSAALAATNHAVAAAAAAATGDALLLEEIPTSLLSPNKGHHALFRSLEELEGLEKEEATLIEHSPLTAPLTQIVTGRRTPTARTALAQLHEFGSIPRRVCQHPFKRNDIVWVCRTRQADETCVLCHACFSQSNHEGHDVAFYHAQAGGCCDCGDPDAWDEAGFCPHHGPTRDTSSSSSNSQSPLAPDQVQRVRGVVPSVVDWMVERIAKNAEAGYQRAMTVKETQQQQQQAHLQLQNASQSQDIEMGDINVNPDNSRTNNNNNDNNNNISNNNNNNDNDTSQGSETDMVFMDGVFSPAEASRPNRPLHLQQQAQAQAQAQPNNTNTSTNSTRMELGNPMAWATSTSNPNSNNPSRLSSTASALLSNANNLNANRVNAFPESLGRIGRDGHGLYLVLYADDIHSPSQWIEALREFLGASSYYTDSLLAKFVRALRQYGQLVVWGTMELVAECGVTNANLWLDGDIVASRQIANALLTRAKKLVANGFFCSIFTRQELQLEQRAVAVLQWMSALARSCDPLCQTVAECILPNRHLVPLLRADFKLSARITKAWYSLLLTLLAVPTFKSHLAAAYCDTYRSVTAKYAAGMGLLERSAYTLSVQFLNRVTYVVDLVQGRDLLGKLGKSLLETLKVAQSDKLQGRLNPNHFVLSHRRYSPCISDLKCVLNVKGMKRLFACKEGTFLADWVAALGLAQFMDTQVWRHWTQGHVEDEVRGWVGAFNLSISLGSLFERLLSWEDEELSPIKDPASPLSGNLLTCVELTCHILNHGLAQWQYTETKSCQPTFYTSAIDPHKRCSASLPFSTIAAKHGCSLALRQLPIAQVTPFSFHLPLHRFLAACLREVCLRQHSSVKALITMISSQLSQAQQDALFRGLMEFPVLVLTRASQVRAGLWRRNGPGLNDQVLNYAEPPFCRSMRDADLLLAQFAVLKRTIHQSPSPRPESDVGVAFLVHLLLHRLGIFDFSGLSKAPNSDINRYLEEVAQQLYPAELRPDSAIHDNDIVLPWTYSPARDAATRLVLLEEFLHLMVIFVVELPPMPPKSKDDHTHQAKERLRREVIHRLASGPKTHSELSEVHLVLSHWDNVFLSEEGKLVNPDDATGAALGAVLEEVADRKSSRGKLEPDKWELRRSAWEAYDPSFFHISLRSHQTAAEARPHPTKNKASMASQKPFGESKAYGPVTIPAHPAFERLRRDVTADATLLAVAYRILHLHCRQNKEKDVSELRSGKFAYENDERSETALARAVHILTLGAFAWEDASSGCEDWRSHGGGSAGSVFFKRPDTIGAPTVSDWIEAALVADPGQLLDCEWYSGEEKAVVLLRRLAVDGGMPGNFIAGDRSVRSGAAWLCEFALKHCPAASAYLGQKTTSAADKAGAAGENSESELQKKKRLAKERAMARMKDQAAKFASMMKVELDDGEDKDSGNSTAASHSPNFSLSSLDTPMEILDSTGAHRHPSRSDSLGSTRSLSSTSVEASGAESDRSFMSGLGPLTPDAMSVAYDDPAIPDRLLKVRPQCIICNDEGNADSRATYAPETGGHKKSRSRKGGGGNALGFVAYAQASTVMKGGGGPPCRDDSIMSPVRRFVGTHVALCGHAVHSECYESYLAIVSHREDRVIGKRDEFRCPLCQRLSNCLVPFIDVGEDWICSPTSYREGASDQFAMANTKSDTDVDMLTERDHVPLNPTVSLQNFLRVTPWWVSRHNPHVVWDGQSAFISKAFLPFPDSSSDRNTHNEAIVSPSKPRRRSVRSLRKKDLYAAWNAMMRTPRFVRRKFRHRSNDESTQLTRSQDAAQSYADHEETTGETVVWRRFMDQVCDVAYRSDSKRLGEDNLHSDFGEFRHYIVEKFSYNLAKRSAGIDPADWPSCVFSTTLSDTQRQELSREKLLSKLLMTIQAFTYSCCCEASEARRAVRKHMLSSREVAGLSESSSLETICSKFGISGVLCDGKMVVIPHPSSSVDEGSQPFNGRIGRLRYLALATMAAAGAVAADLVQLVLSFPHNRAPEPLDDSDMDVEKPDRAPIAFPILLGNVLTHVVAAMSASCGRARARSDSLELVWPVPFSIRGSFAFADGGNGRKKVDSVIEDCEGFLKLGLLARILQVLLAVLAVTPGNLESASAVVASLKGVRNHGDDNMSSLERAWVLSCLSLLEAALGDTSAPEESQSLGTNINDVVDLFNEACVVAAGAACHFLVDISTVLQVLVPGVMGRYNCQSAQMASPEWDSDMSLRTFEKMRLLMEIESVGEMLESTSVVEIVTHWFQSAHDHAKVARAPSAARNPVLEENRSIRHRLYRTQGYRAFDWPMQSSLDWVKHLGKSSSSWAKMRFKSSGEQEPQHEASTSTMQVEAMPPDETPTAEVLRQQASPPALVTFSAKKTVPLIGGHRDETHAKVNSRPRVAVIPTSYTDLYAELGALLPDCEQTAVCLICGEVLNAGGKSECTRHSYKCGAGTGLFFLLQECSGLIMHKGKAAYIHSPYVDSHGETPQYRGRPLNLDLARYDHLREVWSGHGVRQQVLAERGSSRQVIVPDFY